MAILIIAVFAIGSSLIWSAFKAKQKSDQIIEDFDSVSSSLKNSNDSIQNAKDSLFFNLQKKLSK
jgi:hypothetical protein